LGKHNKIGGITSGAGLIYNDPVYEYSHFIVQLLYVIFLTLS
jgi:hypothetical protein